MAKDLLLEIGTEELPALSIGPVLEDARSFLVQKAQEARLAHGEIFTYGTPRRLAWLVKDVVEIQPDITMEVIGPPVKVAYDPQGKATKVGEKWAAGQGVDIASLLQKDTPKGRYVYLERSEKGEPAQKVLIGLLSTLVASIRFKKSMRWGWQEETFSRPVQWIAAVFGEEKIEFSFSDVKSGNVTYGHRFLAHRPLPIPQASQYLKILEDAYVIADVSRRQSIIREMAEKEAHRVGGKLLDDPELLNIVTYLVEHPTAVLGSFDSEFLDLPPQVLVSEAKGHQKYFSVVDKNGKVMPYFVAISNMRVEDPTVSQAGYERVLRARLSDARFFYTEDRKRTLESRVENLKRVVFQQKLGTSFEKMERFRAIGEWLAQEIKIPVELVARAAFLCKADLVTGMVGEFPELQGEMGREYAKGVESDEVAQAIYEHYLPRFSGDKLPSGNVGAVVGIADRLDTIVGIIGIGKGPTGAADPYGLRRACLAVVNIVLGLGYRFSLSQAVDRALEQLGAKIADPCAIKEQVLDFFRERLRNLWAENARKDVVEAVLSVGFDDLVETGKRLAAMNTVVGRPDFEPLAIAFKRVVNIVEKQAREVRVCQIAPALLTEDAERALFQAYESTCCRIESAVKDQNFAVALNEIAQLKPAVDLFFDQVRVLVDDSLVRENRVALLTAIGRLFGGIADFSKIQAGEAWSVEKTK